MKILVVGGAGYVGSRLVPALLDEGHKVVVLDLFLYGEDVFSSIQNHSQLTLIKADIRDFTSVEKALNGCDAVIHLACISNDPSFELNPFLGKSINLDAFEPFVKMSIQQKVRRFIFASSSSVYGVKSEPNVTEDMKLEPLTDYSKYKAECEKILLKYLSSDFIGTVIRPATVCGYAPRQRLDVIVNILTSCAYHTGIVKVTGGSQMRPNLHIEDMVRAYIHVLGMQEAKVQGEIFNVGAENYTVMELAKMAQKTVSKKRPVELVVEPTNDNRSYRVSSEKIYQKLGFKPQFTIEDAMNDLVLAFDQGKVPNALSDKKYFNIKTMKEINLV